MFENILNNFDEEKIKKSKDISIFSGLSGVGLFFLSFYKIVEGGLLEKKLILFVIDLFFFLKTIKII